MTEQEIMARLSELQAALLREGFGSEGLSEAARRRAADLVVLLKRDMKKRPAPGSPDTGRFRSA